jgi:hypothetical protein
MNKALHRASALLIAVTSLLTLTATAQAAPNHRHSTQLATANYSCRSASKGAYWYGGIESDACDGPVTDGTFGGEAITGMDPNGTINHTSGTVTSCTVQLNHVVNGVAYAVPGASNTESGGDPAYFDGRFCDAFGSWRPAAGYYNVTTLYRHNGVLYQTVQGPVKYYPGG